MTARRRRTSGRGDDGVVLVMALVVVMVFGAVAAAIAGFAATSFKHTRNVREQTDLRASADAGVRITIDQLTRHQTLCTDFGAPPTRLATRPNDATVDVQCSYLSGDTLGASTWALVLTAQATVTALNVVQGNVALSGSVFFADPGSAIIQAGAGLTVANGDLWYTDSDCSGSPPASVTNLVGALGVVPPFGAQCTTSSWDRLVPTITPPPRPADAINSQGVEYPDVPGCRVFFPGTYTTAPALSDDNYFVSGDYYFTDPITISAGQRITGGRVDPTLGDTPSADPGPCGTADENADVAAGEEGYGVTWFLGGQSRITVDALGRLELFRRRQGTQAVSIATVEQTDGGYEQSSVTADTDSIISAGSTVVPAQMTIHGLVSAPRGKASIGGLVSTSPAFVGGAVLASIDIDAALSLDLATLSPPPTQTKLLVSSTAIAADGAKVTVQAVIDYKYDPLNPDPNQRTVVAINSWRKV